jgi:hypothetical protein
MNIETVDKCLNFASGDKNHQVATGIRNKEFPENLLRGNAKERELRRYKESGVPLNELKRWQGQSTTSGYRYIIDTMQRKEELYNAWAEFWSESEERIRPMRLSALCEDVTDEEIQSFLRKLESLGVVTVEDFLIDCTTLTLQKMRDKYGRGTPVIRKSRHTIIQKIRECYPHSEDGTVLI